MVAYRDPILQNSIKPLQLRIEFEIQQATKNLHDNREDGVHRAKRLLTATGAPLESLVTKLGADHTEVQNAGDKIAEAFLACMRAYGEATNDWNTCIYLLSKGHRLATSKALRERYTRSKAAAQSCYTKKQFYETCWFCKKNRAANHSKKEVAFHQLTNDFLKLSSGAAKWRHLKVSVPRCPLCKKKHLLMRVCVVSFILGGSIGIFHESLLSIGVGVAVGAFISWMIGLKVEIVPRGCYDFPIVKEMLSQGWHKGGQPWTAAGSSILLSVSLRSFLLFCGSLVVAGIFLLHGIGAAAPFCR